MRNTNIQKAFAYIVKTQKDLEGIFKKTEIDLSLVTAMNNPELPAFRSFITDSSGTSLDIEFKNKNDIRLTVHLFNRKAFGLTFGEEVGAGNYPLKKLNEKGFLDALRRIYNTPYKNVSAQKKSFIEFVQNFR